MQRKSRGFTLIELLIVVSVIAVLTIAALFGFSNAITRAKVIRALSDIQMIRQAVEQYHADTGYYPPNPIAGIDPGLETYQNPGGVCNTSPFNRHGLCPNGLTTWNSTFNAFVQSRWRGPYAEWPDETPWGGEYDYDYHVGNVNIGGCTYGPGVYIAMGGPIPGSALDMLDEKGLEVCAGGGGNARLLIKILDIP